MVIKEQHEKVRLLRLAHPPANVLNLKLLETLRAEVSEAAADPGCSALVIASAYPRYFSAGLDLDELLALPNGRSGEHFRRLIEVYRALRALPKPTVAAIGGSALLGGWIVAMACDYRLLSEDGRVSLSEIRFGISPSAALVSRVLQICASPTIAKELVLKGRTLRAPEALAGGLVDRLSADVIADALREAKILARQPAASYAAVKKALFRGTDDEELWRESLEEFEELFATEDARKGLAAMRDKKRRPAEEEA